jgi:choice-of-anchor A domain-containing protein
MHYYNLVVLQNLTVSSNVRGRAFVGANVNWLSGPSFGSAGTSSPLVSLEVAGLVLGGTGSSEVHGNMVVSTLNSVTNNNVNDIPISLHDGTVTTCKVVG